MKNKKISFGLASEATSVQMSTAQTLCFMCYCPAVSLFTHIEGPPRLALESQQPLAEFNKVSSVCVCVCSRGEDDQRKGHCWGILRKRPHFLGFTLWQNSLSSADHLPPDQGAEPNTQNTRRLNGLQFAGGSTSNDPLNL